MNLIACIILLFLLAEYALNLVADNLNLGAVSDRVPPLFEDVYDPEKYRQSQLYLRVNTRFEQAVGTIDLLVLLVFWFCGGFAVIDRWTRAFGWGEVTTGIVYILVLAGLKAAIDQVPGLYHTFVIEQRFGFNKTTLKTWVMDRIKGLALALVLGVPLIAAVLAFLNTRAHRPGSGVGGWSRFFRWSSSSSPPHGSCPFSISSRRSRRAS